MCYPEQLILDKLNLIYKIYKEFCSPKLSNLDIINNVLICAVNSDVEGREINELYRKIFRKTCFRMSAKHEFLSDNIFANMKNLPLINMKNLNNNNDSNMSSTMNSPMNMLLSPAASIQSNNNFNSPKNNKIKSLNESIQKMSIIRNNRPMTADADVLEHRNKLKQDLQYNIVEDYLNENTFINVLCECPELLLLVEKSFNDRIYNFYEKSK